MDFPAPLVCTVLKYEKENEDENEGRHSCYELVVAYQ